MPCICSEMVVATPVNTVTVTSVVEPRLALPGDTTHVAFTGAAVQLNVAVPVIPVADCSRSGKVALFPFAIVADVLPSAMSVKSTPTPVNASVCGELGALSVIVSTPVLVPAAEG